MDGTGNESSPLTVHGQYDDALRHSYATGLLERGVDLLTIQRLLGHSTFSSTLIYLHVRRPRMESVASPFDWLPVAACPTDGLSATASTVQNAPVASHRRIRRKRQAG
jgi:hypothetical protein